MEEEYSKGSFVFVGLTRYDVEVGKYDG